MPEHALGRYIICKWVLISALDGSCQRPNDILCKINFQFHPKFLNDTFRYLAYSVTGFGEISSLWPKFKLIGQHFECLFSIWHNFESTLANSVYFLLWIVIKWINKIKIWSHCWSTQGGWSSREVHSKASHIVHGIFNREPGEARGWILILGPNYFFVNKRVIIVWCPLCR